MDNKKKLLLGTQAALVAVLVCFCGSIAASEPFTYEHVWGTGDPAPDDPHPPAEPKMNDTVSACDAGALTDSGFMAYVCSLDGDKNSNGGVFHPAGGTPYRTFRREDNLPGQEVQFEKAVIPFGIPFLHPVTGDTYVTIFFDRIQDEDVGLSNRQGARQKGVYVYDRLEDTLKLIADTTAWSEPLPKDGEWSDFNINVVVSEAGAFFVGDYVSKGGQAGQGIYRYVDGKLTEIVAQGVTPPAEKARPLADFRGVAANARTVFFVGESASCARRADAGSCVRGLYAHDLGSGKLSTILTSGMDLPGGGTFKDFAVEPATGIYHNSIATNQTGDLVLVAAYEEAGASHQGVFLLKKSAGYVPDLILSSGAPRRDLLMSDIDSFNTVAINARAEIAFVVANDDQAVPTQGLVFYRNSTEGLRSVFKEGDTFLADLKHSSCDYKTVNHGGLISGSQALDSSEVPRLFFRHLYQVEGDPLVYSMLVIATLHE